MDIKQVHNPKQEFFDKHGNQIKVGDKIKTNIDDQFLDGYIHEKEGKLGLFFKHADYFVRLDKMLDRFFDSVEIVKGE